MMPPILAWHVLGLPALPHAECTELYLGNKGIEKIRGFEEFVNLEYLCINGNKLKKINNLDENFRIKVLHAQDNQICTLKGSLACFRNLEQLDLSNNQLRDLAKLLPELAKFQFLTHLNLKGNPCCEEPDYRLLVVHAMQGLKVLDQHVITAAERLKAKASIGGDVAALTVAFGKRAPPRELERVPERSLLERELAKVGLARNPGLMNLICNESFIHKRQMQLILNLMVSSLGINPTPFPFVGGRAGP